MIKCEKSKVSLIEDDIIFIEVEQDRQFSLRDYREAKLASVRLVNNREVFSMIHMGDKTIPDKEAREACTKDTGKGLIKAEAIVIHSLGQRIVARHVLKKKRKQFPVKLFSNVDKAKAWLRNMKNENN